MKKFDEETKKAIADAYAAGTKIADIQNEYSVTAAFVRSCADAFGVPRRNKRRSDTEEVANVEETSNISDTSLDEYEQKGLLTKFVCEGYTLHAVSHIYNISYEEALRIVEKYGYSLDDRGTIAYSEVNNLNISSYHSEGISYKRKVRRGEIYWVEYAYSSPQDTTVEGFKPKARPALVMSCDYYNGSASVIVCYLTSKDKSMYKNATLVQNVQLKSTTANKQSWVCCSQISQIFKDALGDYIGKIDDDEMAEVEKCLCGILDIEPTNDSSEELGKVESKYKAKIEELNETIESLKTELDNASSESQTENDTELSIELKLATQKAEIYKDVLERMLSNGK